MRPPSANPPPAPPNDPTDDEFRTALHEFLSESERAIEAFALRLDPTNTAPYCSCDYHTGRASVYLHMKLDDSTREAAEVIRKASNLRHFSEEMRLAIVRACEQVAEWTRKNVEETLGVRSTLTAPPRVYTPRERYTVPSEQEEIACTSPTVKGTH